MKTITRHEQKSLTSSQNSTLQIPPGGKIHGLMLHFLTSAGASVTEAQIRSEINNIRFSVNGKDLVNASPVIILDSYEFLGSNVHNNTAVAGGVELNVARMLFTDPAVRDIFGIGTADVNSIQVHVTAGTLSAIASVEAYTEREASAENMGAYCRLINYPVSQNATGDLTVDSIPRNTETTYLAALVSAGASGTITHSEVKVNSIAIRERVPLNINKLSLSNSRLEQPSGYHCHAFTDGSLGQRLPMFRVNDFRFINTFSVAAGAGGYSISMLSVENLPANL